jgi:hypothetical protein
MNHYDTLEVSAKASPAVIKAAYKSLVQRYHPDKNSNDSDSAQRTSVLVQAYEVLSDPARRAAYDQALAVQEASARAAPDSKATRTAPAGRPRSAAPAQAKSYGIAWAVILVTILGALWFLSSRNALRLPGADPKTRTASPDSLALTTPAVVATPGALPSAPAPNTLAKEASALPAMQLMQDISVVLTDMDGLNASSWRILKIPLLGLESFDAKKLNWFLDDNKALVRKKIEASLANAKYADLSKPDHQKYLDDLILSAVAEAAGPNFVDNTARPALLKINMPRQFTIEVYDKNINASPIPKP